MQPMCSFVELFHEQRKLGFRDGGVGSHVDLPVAWTDLALLSQCAGKLQEGISYFIYPLTNMILVYVHKLSHLAQA